MSHRYDANCRCAICGPLNAERYLETCVDRSGFRTEPEKERDTGYINGSGDEYSNGRIVQHLKADGSMTYRFLRTT